MISLIVPLWNHVEDLTKPFVESMLKCSGDFELILVDNGSMDGTKKYLSSLTDKRIKKVYSNINLGFGGGNNLGYKVATGDMICFISNDVIIKDFDWLKMFEDRLMYRPDSLLGVQLVDYNQFTNYKRQPTPYIAGWCMFGYKEMFDKVAEKNGTFDTRPQVFDEDFGLAYFEDVWLSCQCEQLGYQMAAVPAQIHHIVSGSTEGTMVSSLTVEAQKVFLDKMTQYDLKTRGVKRIVFICNGVPYGFIDGDYEGRGVGGAEASIILLARELAKNGWEVEIYNKTEKVGKFGDVYYRHISEFEPSTFADVYVLFRSYHESLIDANATVKIFWSCDQYTDKGGVWDAAVFPYVDKVIAISPYHKKYLDSAYKTQDKVTVLELGIKGEDYKIKPEKVKGKAIFCSIPDRGLDVLVRCLPLIKQIIPEFNLTITSDYRLWGVDNPGNQGYIEAMRFFPWVNFVGKVPRSELVQHQLESEIMIYPSNYPECFCISAMECMAAGATPVTKDMGALKTTVSWGGIVLSNRVPDREYVESVVNLFKNKNLLSAYRKAGYQIAENHDWPLVAKRWISLLNRLEVKIMNDGSDKQVTPLRPGKPRVAEKPVVEAERPGKVVKKSSQPKSDYVLKKPATEPKAEKAPEEVNVSVLPKKVVLRFRQAVEVNIGGALYKTSPVKTYHEMEIPFELSDGIATIVAEAYSRECQII